MKQALMNCVQPQIMGHIDEVDAKELGEAVDMLKDLSEAIYYCTVTEAMKKEDKQTEEVRHYSGGMAYPMMYQSRYYDEPRMYYEGRGGNTGRDSRGSNEGNEGRDGNSGNNQSGSGSRSYTDPTTMHMMNDPSMMRDYREGRSGMRRKTYMEGKQYFHDKTKQMHELEAYMQELTTDITEMIQDASPEEKQMLQQKISALATKIK